ncbi:N-acetylglucosamine-6-phosphate deacetylase [Phyllobacterium zundukense]|uniref:N-acetylglucosamine-6-phosphate deacetylase n=1 Tax=Phyllobacterium zundukense TaxID=1867719 RepID=A0A2N9VZ31_9HYPH|nr:N-acetylglucosamine-6-phosphate deacetylase [Phyllobacterium zundukense]ATU90991.1 N-acetylglucosamine-6-phosphate deacetylase [Phyllobacterium zundukense]PIO44749.1 N-acetylglucosamine-6-phosphate deacetylase [Phyllobacterium zundukense]
MSTAYALTGAEIFDGENWHADSALIIDGGVVKNIAAASALPGNIRKVELKGGMLVPGFIDVQVNGGGGVLLNDGPSVEAIRTICDAHFAFGTTALLPTLITDTPEITAAALTAGKAAAQEKVAGFIGLHIEGPHLSVTHKGTHDPKLIRPMDDADLVALIEAVQELPVLLTTIAPETVPIDKIRALADAGVIVSLGHSGASYEVAMAAKDAGATMATHLFNAMSQLGHRTPGMVGAVLQSGELSAGLIADGFHVDKASMAIALRAKRGPAKIFLVTDAMSTIGTDITSFTLNGRKITRAGGRLTLEDGTLAGADLDMISAVRFVHRELGLPLDEALRMASLYPAQSIRIDHHYGRLTADYVANIVHLDDKLDVNHVWIDGDSHYAR